MRIEGTNTAMPVQQGAMGGANSNDPVAKGLQDRIKKAQQELKELSANQDMSVEQKQKKRQELQQEINDLTMQLRQHQIEQKQKENQEKQNAIDELSGNSKMQENGQTTEKGGVIVGLSAEGMEALISADGSKKQAQVQGTTARQLEGKANVLEEEIRQDMALGKGVNIGKKQEDMAKLRRTAQTAQTSQLNTLAEAGRELEEVSETENEAKAESQDVDKMSEDNDTDQQNGTGDADNDRNGQQEDKNAVTVPVDVRI